MERRKFRVIRRDERIRVRPDCEERRVAEIEQPGEADHDVEPDREQHVDAGVRGLRDQEAPAAARGDLHADRKGERPDPEQDVHHFVRVLPRVVLPRRPD